MSKAIQRFSLDVTHPDVQATVRIVQGDDNRQWRFTFTKAGEPFDLPPRCTAMLVGTKPDDTVLQNGLVVQGNEAIYDFGAADPTNHVEQISTVPGSFEIQIILFDEAGNILHLPRMWVVVYASSYTAALVAESESQFGGIKELIARLVEAEGQVEALEKLVTTQGTVTISPTQWTNNTPYRADVSMPGDVFGKGCVVLLVPEDDETKKAASKAMLSMSIDKTMDYDTPNPDWIVIARAESGIVPTIPLNFRYVVLKTGTEDKALVAMIGVDAVGAGTGNDTATGVDESAVRAIINQVVPAWARESTKPTYTKDEVGLGNVDNAKQYSESNPPDYPVDSVNGKTGKVSLSASDVNADPAGTAATKVSDHDTYTGSHSDIRLLLQTLSNRLNAFLDTDDTTLDELSEIVAYIKSNKTLIDSITTSKVNVTDIINNLTTNVTNKPLSAAQGVALKKLIDTLSSGKLDASALTAAKLAAVLGYTPANAANVPTKLSQLTDDSTHRTVTDEEKADWGSRVTREELEEAVKGAGGSAGGANYTNLADQTSSDWADDKRINSSKQEVSATGVDITNYIPISPTAAFIHVKGLDILSALASGSNYGRLYYYDASKAYLGYASPSSMPTHFSTASYDDTVTVVNYQTLGDAIKNSVTIANVAYVRLGGIPTASDIIITVDEDIIAKEGSSEYEERITDLEERVTALEANTIVVPDYWQTAVDEAITKVKALQDEGGSDVVNFVWFSDLHYGGGKDYTGNVGILCAAVMDACDIPLALMNGDTLTAGSLATEEAVLTNLEGAMTDILAPIGDERLMLVRGNHDDVYGSYTDGDTTTYYVNKVAPEKVWNILHRPQATDTRRVFGGDGTYFYLDNVPHKVRFVCLNSHFYEGEAVTNGTTKLMTTGFGAEQLDWLENVALAVDEGWGVVVAMHTPPISAYASQYTSEDYTRVRSIITAAADRMIAVFCGHMHRDIAYTDDLPCPIVVITCAADSTYDSTEADRTAGTATETAIDIVSINRATKTIHTTRLGVGSDRSVSYTGGEASGENEGTGGTLSAQWDEPITTGAKRCLARVKQMRDIKYTPVADLPYNYGTYEAGTEIQGLTYSSVRKTDKFIGYNVSLHTFMTALHNPKSVLYTKSGEESTAINGAIATTWYGVNCSTFVSYAYDWPYHNATAIIPFMDDVVEILPEEMKLCDMACASFNTGGTVGHVVIITGLKRNQNGYITDVEISEAGSIKVAPKKHTFDDFITLYLKQQGYKIYRYKKIYDVTYTPSEYIPLFDEEAENIIYSDLCTNLGDKATIRTDESITLNPLNTAGYTAIKLYKDGSEIGSYAVSDVELSGLSAGTYVAKLYPFADNAETSFIVSKVKASRYGNRYSFTGDNPMRVVFKDSGGYSLHAVDLSEEDIVNGYIDIDYTDSAIAQVCVPFKNEYGFNVACFNYADEENPADALPDEYQQVEYIATDGNQYIDTGVLASNYPDGIKYYAVFSVDALHASLTNNYLFGALGGGVRSGNVSITSDAVRLMVGVASQSVKTTEALKLDKKYTLNVFTSSNFDTIAQSTLIISDKTTYDGTTQPTAGTMPAANIFLMACNLNGNPTSGTSAMLDGKLYRFKMSDANDTVIRNFVPCYRKSDNVIGLYDIVGEQLYTNGGTGAFTKGADV